MKFTGKSLLKLRGAVQLALFEIHNQIATCPDVELYAEDLDDLEEEQTEYEALLARIDEAILKEGKR